MQGVEGRRLHFCALNGFCFRLFYVVSQCKAQLHSHQLKLDSPLCMPVIEELCLIILE